MLTDTSSLWTEKAHRQRLTSDLGKGRINMSEFTFLFRGRRTSGSPEESQQHFQKWAAWFKELGAKGHLKNYGHPLENQGKVVRGKTMINEGPWNC